MALQAFGTSCPAVGLSVYRSKSRNVCCSIVAKKGFTGGKAGASQVKVNERGKISSRPGPISPKQQQKKIEAHDVATPVDEAVSVSASVQQEMQPAASTSAPSAPSGVPTRESMPVRETPQIVVDRMFKRMVTFAGVPMLTGFALFPLFWYLRVIQHVDYPLWLVLIAQSFTFGGGLLGITYGVLSSSWNPSIEGSFWGWNEMQANVKILMDNKDRR